VPNPGDIIRLWDRHTRPPKVKWHICICPQRQLFLRINTDPIFPPVHPISQANNPWLEHDSFVELQQLVRHLAYEIQQADHLGTLTRFEAESLCEAVKNAETLNEEQQQLICERLLGG
jgi:hypothetical protein